MAPVRDVFGVACVVASWVSAMVLVGCSGPAEDQLDGEAVAVSEPGSQPTADVSAQTPGLVAVDVDSVASMVGRGLPADLVVPEPEQAEDIDRFLSGDGQHLVQLLDASEPLAVDRVLAGSECQVVARGLQGLASPEDLVDLTGAIGDVPTREIAVNFIAATARQVAVCGSPESVETSGEFAFQWRLWQLRVEAMTR